jgi:two-component system, cell cycle response regulator DivK
VEETILLVEDNPLNIELATDILQVAGYNVLLAETADRAIALARSQKPALILMDLSLPGMDGLTATEILKRDPQTRAIPLVALTAHAMKGNKEKAIAAGCDDYMTKPVDAKSLISTVVRFTRS